MSTGCMLLCTIIRITSVSVLALYVGVEFVDLGNSYTQFSSSYQVSTIYEECLPVLHAHLRMLLRFAFIYGGAGWLSDTAMRNSICLLLIASSCKCEMIAL